MEGQRFDQLSRRLASSGTRRQALKALAGAVIASVVGGRGAAAQACVAQYSPCTSDDQCCAGAVCEYGICMPGCRINGVFINAGMSPPDNICAVCQPATSTTSLSPANEGTSCWSGDPNAGSTFCRNGSCVAKAPHSCPPPTACHLEGSVDPATGLCTNPPAPAGTPCGAGASCIGGNYQPPDACDGNGFCIGGGAQIRPCAPYLCGAGQCTTSCASDADCAESAHCDGSQCINDLNLGAPCDEDSDCKSGICSDGVCCDRRCDERCKTCSAANGGRCTPVVCDDGLACTSGACVEATGQCVHTLNPGTCLIAGVCYTSGAANPQDGCQVCDPARSTSAWSARSCPGGVCFAGACCTPQMGTCPGAYGCCASLECANGHCLTTCPLGGFRCGLTCCASYEHCVNDVCTCVPLRGACNSANNLCCQEQETLCPASNPYGNANTCCRPQGGGCSSAADCCFEVYDPTYGRDTCGDDGICGGSGAYCGTASDCIAGRSCYGLCFGVGLGFHLCQSDGDCPDDVNGNASSCRQKRCVYPNELPT